MSTTIPAEVVIWQFGGKTGNLKSQNAYTTNSGYNLFCSSNKEYLSYGTELFGINLDWKKTGDEKKVHFMVPAKQEREILTGEPIAFGIGGGEQFLYYASRTLGINLSWSEKPVFEWTICGADGKKGVPIGEGQMYAIVNAKVQPAPDFFIYLDRVPGQADVGWTTSPNWPGKILSNIQRYKEVAAFVAALL
jgi:hypothetical protein